MMERTQWRFMWLGAAGDELGAEWRDARPTPDEVAEWREDLLDVWVETRVVVEGPAIRDTDFDRVTRPSFDVNDEDCHGQPKDFGEAA